MHGILDTTPTSIVPRNNMLRKPNTFFDWQFQWMILHSIVNLDRKFQCCVIQILAIKVCVHLQCLNISYRLQFLVNTFNKIKAREKNENVIVEYSNLKRETALKSVLILQSNINLNSK